MALPFSLYFTIEDESGDQSTVTLPIISSTDQSSLLVAVRSFGNLIDPLVDGVIVSAGVQLEMDISTTAWKGLVNVGADIEEGARFLWRSAQDFTKSLRLPTFKESLVDAAGNVDMADSDVAAFNTAVISGVDLTTLGGVGATEGVTIHDEDLTTTDYAKEHFVASRS